MRGEARRLPGEDPSRPLPSAPGLLPSSQPAGRRWKRVGSGAVSTAEGTAGELAGAKGVSTEQRSAAQLAPLSLPLPGGPGDSPTAAEGGDWPKGRERESMRWWPPLGREEG